MVLELKLRFLPLCSSPKIMLAMRTLLYATEMNPLSVGEPELLGSEALHFLLLTNWGQKHFRSTSLSSSKQKCQYNAIFSSELVHSFE